MADNYEFTRKRVTRFYNNTYMSDKDIIEALSVEIEQYRNKIRALEGNTYKVLEENTCPKIEIGFHWAV